MRGPGILPAHPKATHLPALITVLLVLAQGLGTFSCTQTQSPGTSPRSAATSSLLKAEAPLASGNLHLNWTNWTVSGGPGARSGAAVTYDPLDHYVLLFSGVPRTGPYLPDTWSYANGTWREICSGSTSAPKCATEPAADNLVPMTYDAADQYVLMLNATGRTWSFSGGNWTQRSVNQTLNSGTGAGMAYDPALQKVLLVLPSAGIDCSTYTYSNGTWTQLSTTYSVPNRQHEALFYDPQLSRMVLFGGISPDGTQVYGDMWTFTQGQWTHQTPAVLPPAGVPTGFSYDAAFREGILLTGGVAGNYTWAYSNGSWTNQTPFIAHAPPPRDEAQMTYDGADGYTLMFGGVTLSGTMTDTWLESAPLTQVLTLSSSTIDLNQTVAIGSSAQGGVSPYTARFESVPPGCAQPTGAFNFSCRPSQPGTFLVTEKISDQVGANATSTRQVQVNPDPTAIPAVAPNPVTSGVPVLFTVSVTGGTAPIISNWTFGDGNFSDVQSVAHIYGAAGTYTAHFVGVDARGIAANASVTVRVNPSPVAAGTLARNVTDVGTRDFFNGTAAGGTAPFTFVWKFGDGNVSLLENASHAFGRAGTFSPSVTVTDALGVNDSAVLNVLVHPDPIVVANANVTATVVNTTVRFTSTASGGTTPYNLTWNFGDGAVSFSPNSTHAFATPGNFTVSFTLRDSVGFTRVSTFVLTVNALPTQPTPVHSSGLTPTQWLLLGVGLVLAAAGGGVVSWVIYSRRRRASNSDDSGARPAGDEGVAPDSGSPPNDKVE